MVQTHKITVFSHPTRPEQQVVMDSSMIHQTHLETEIHQAASDVAKQDICDTNAEPRYSARIAEATATAKEHAENSLITLPAHLTATYLQGTT